MPYAEGLDAMNEGRWSDAGSAFSHALEVGERRLDLAGKMDVQTGRDPVRGRPESPRGQMMLYDETS